MTNGSIVLIDRREASDHIFVDSKASKESGEHTCFHWDQPLSWAQWYWFGTSKEDEHVILDSYHHSTLHGQFSCSHADGLGGWWRRGRRNRQGSIKGSNIFPRAIMTVEKAYH